MWRWWRATTGIFTRAECWPVEFCIFPSRSHYWGSMADWIEYGGAIESVEQVPCDIC